MARDRAILSVRERARAARFAHPRHRRRYAAAQAHLRRVLALETGAAPDRIRFRFGAHGKPYLPDGPSFNQSHSGERIMIAVTAQGRLGVDIEEIRPVRLMMQIARRRLADYEAELLARTPPADRLATFFRIWTRKEAWLKALGVGLSHPLGSFSVDPSPAALQGLLDAGDLAENPVAWHLGSAPCSPGAEAAVALDCARVALEPLPYQPPEQDADAAEA